MDGLPIVLFENPIFFTGMEIITQNIMKQISTLKTNPSGRSTVKGKGNKLNTATFTWHFTNTFIAIVFRTNQMNETWINRENRCSYLISKNKFPKPA